MSRAYRVALPIGAVLILVALFSCTYPPSPQHLENASGDSNAVWMALLKGFSGDVVYVGSDDTHAYFRIGSTYYKVAACGVRLPERFSVGQGEPYVVHLHVEQGEVRVVSDCAKGESGQPLGQVDRK